MDALLIAISEVADPLRLAMLATGVVVGLVIGVIPGIGGLFGLSILLPLSFSLDPYSAFALLLGMASVTTTSDTIPAVLIGVPGTVGAITTVIDGHPLALKGEAERTLGAAYTASLIGGLFGALVLALVIPVMRPLVLSLDSSDFFAISCLGLLFVTAVSGPDPFKGAIALCLGLALSFIGLDPVTASERMTGGWLYLWDGLPVSVVFLGLFALPEMSTLLGRGRIAPSGAPQRRRALFGGMREALRAWPTILRSSAIGALVGAVPGVGVMVIDWIAYSVEARFGRFRPGEAAFGQGNIRGVIAPESANNAKEGGSLIPTLAIGVPASASMSLLLGAFLIQGLAPGPSMLDKDLPVTISFVIFIALANVLGAGICLAFTPQLARLAQVPAIAIVPVSVVLMTLGAWQARNDVGDFILLLAVGMLGIIMARLSWPRPAFSLGFVLGPVIERFFFLSFQNSGAELLMRPSVILLCLVTLALVAGRRRRAASKPRLSRGDRLFAGAVLVLGAGLVSAIVALPFEARLFPLIVIAILLGAAMAVLIRGFRQRVPRPDSDPASVRGPFTVLAGTGICVALIYLIGALPGCFVLIMGWGLMNRRKWHVVFIEATAMVVTAHLVFQQLAGVVWPEPLLAQLLRP